MKKIKFIENLISKLNPAQSDIVDDYGENQDVSANLYTNQQAYNKVEVVNRGINLITDSAADIRIDVGDIMDFFGSPTRIRKKKLDQLLNFRPNPYYNADVLKRNIYIDLLLEGNAFIYFDGAYLYNLPASNVKINTDKKTYIKSYEYADTVFKPEEIIHIKEISGDNVFRGTSRLDAAKKSLITLVSMLDYQKNFFDNAAIPGLVLTTPNPLSDRVKNRLLASWMAKYNPRKGGKRPMILDGEFKVEALSKYSFNELDFNESIKRYEETVLKVLGVPPILLDSGNNANITPNLKMFYLTTVLPLVDKTIQSIEMYFGYDIKPVTQSVLALRPELKDLANYLSTLTNAGIMKRNEAREEIRLEAVPGEVGDELILPANIAGSAQDAGVGGRPPNNEETDGNQE
jgi:HK97 family phage portal protein